MPYVSYPTPTPAPKPVRYEPSTYSWGLSSTQIAGRQYDTSAGEGAREVPTYDEVIDILEQNGLFADRLPPEYLMRLRDPAYRVPFGDPAMRDILIASLKSQYGGAVTDYDKAKGLYFPRGWPAPPARKTGEPSLLDRFTWTGTYVVDNTTGAIMYRNGVIVAPDGQVFWPEGDPEAEGSRAWMDKVREEWGPEEIRTQKKMLVQLGYLPKSAAKDPRFTQEFEAALRAYWASAYQHRGKALPSETAAQQARPRIDLDELQASIASEVTSQFTQIYGVMPSREEVEAWTNFVIRTGERLMRKGFSSEAAISEGQARLVQEYLETPQGKFLAYQDENTSLRDGLIAAVIATRSLL